jgi:hypothetical protein
MIGTGDAVAPCGVPGADLSSDMGVADPPVRDDERARS